MRVWSFAVLVLGLGSIVVSASHEEVEHNEIEAVLRVENDLHRAARNDANGTLSLATRVVELRNRIDRWQRSIADDFGARCDSNRV